MNYGIAARHRRRGQGCAETHLFLTIPRRITTFVVTMSILGLHHVTSLASDPQRNLDFYTGLLGLRLVKQTVDFFYAPDVYHFYFGDEIGRPGTISTFFPFPKRGARQKGSRETSAVAVSAPPEALTTWTANLSREGVPFTGPFAADGSRTGHLFRRPRHELNQARGTT